MKPGSLIAELLPYIPDVAPYGGWVIVTDSPTPIGVHFRETDLRHIGHKLGRESSPYCHGDETNDCWTNVYWDTRDFVLTPEAVHDILSRFIINRPTSCEEYQLHSKVETGMVVYNAPCAFADSAPNNSTEFKPHHFYWDE
jgi:hypothetical protein